ncbi:MAG: hypothetical protein ABI208_01105, partial [Ginsengibacter sp.]
MKKILILFTLSCVISYSSFALSDTTDVPIWRVGFHDKIKAQQKRADLADGRLDGMVKVGDKEEISLEITDALIRKVNVLRNDIEINPKLPTNNDKIRYLRYVEFMVRDFVDGWKSHLLTPDMAPLLVDNFTEIYKANILGKNMSTLIEKMPYEVGRINANIFYENSGFEESKKILFQKFSKIHPDKILVNLAPFVDEPFAPALVIEAFNNSPSQLYSYAQSIYSPQGKLIQSMDDNRIQMVVKLSKLPRALFYFPFLDNLISGKQNIDSLAKLAGTSEANYDSVGYYKLLVQTEIDYHYRLTKGDTPVAMLGVNGLADMLRTKAIEHFVTPINLLHESPDPIRFKAIEPLNAQDLYYMMVMGENDIYTSSYKYSFDKMIQKMGVVPHGDSLLLSVKLDKFKKFIKMAAGYAKLDQFLQTMPKQNADKLMQAFVSKLESSGSLEDAVDVADSYGSVSPEVQQSMLKNIIWNEERCQKENNENGVRIYNLLKTIFLSADPKNGVDLSQKIGIPPVYTVSNKYLSDEKGRIIELVFFYGDTDGKASYASYMTSFPKSEWSITYKKEWVEIKSIKGKPVWIFANLPLDNETDKDALAQKNLLTYLDSNNLVPSVVIHRGHSYHLPYTIDQLPSNAKIIMLGSCGGYQNLKNILDYAPDAHIISTKQTGTMNVNKSIIDALDNTLRAAKDIDWRQMWSGLESSFSKAPKVVKETFEDYIPPQKNLGALFIKAYKKQG